MTVRSVPLTLLGVGALWWLFYLVSDISLFADIGTVCLGVALVLVALSFGPGFGGEGKRAFGFVEGVAGAYGGAVALVAYRLLADPRSDLSARRIAGEGPLLQRPTGVVVPETAVGLAIAAAFAIGLARDRREHGAAAFLALPPAVVSVVALAQNGRLATTAAFTVVLTASGAAAVLFYAARYLRAGGEMSDVTLGYE